MAYGKTSTLDFFHPVIQIQHLQLASIILLKIGTELSNSDTFITTVILDHRALDMGKQIVDNHVCDFLYFHELDVSINARCVWNRANP